jgi:hypothetical protein
MASYMRTDRVVWGKHHYYLYEYNSLGRKLYVHHLDNFLRTLSYIGLINLFRNLYAQHT